MRRPPRALKRQAGVTVAKAFFALGSKPSYILDFELGCRCQAVGNSVSPGGVMSVAHPPSKLTTKVIYDCCCCASRGNFRPFARRRLKPMELSFMLLALSIGECQPRVRGHDTFMEGFREISTAAGSRADPSHRGRGEDQRRHHHPRHRQGKADGGRGNCGRPWNAQR